MFFLDGKYDLDNHLYNNYFRDELYKIAVDTNQSFDIVSETARKFIGQSFTTEDIVIKTRNSLTITPEIRMLNILNIILFTAGCGVLLFLWNLFLFKLQ